MKKPEISIIIVSFNTAKELEECLKTIRQPATSNQQPEVIVVDNASSDGSIEIIKKFKNVKLIENKKNLGFARANNQGAEIAKGNYLFFLNPDTEVKPDTILELLEFSKQHPNSIVGPKLLNPDGSLQGSCYNLPTVLGAIAEYWFSQKGAFEKFAPKGGKLVKVQAIVGAAMFMSKKIFEKLGGFNERYFLYYEDLDFCRKAAKLKIPVYYLPQAVVIHSLGKAGGNIHHLKKSAKVYHGPLKYFLITLVIKGGLRWQEFLRKILH